MDAKPVLVTGASGYIGGRLVPRLLDAGYSVRCLVRSPRKLQARTWFEDPRVEIVQSDVEDEAALERAMRGCGASYYLIHSMLVAGKEYRERDRELASSFAAAARKSGLERIIYLGGLGETGANLSEHLASRREVESALASGGIPVTTLRAAMIIGSASASFEILRYLVERLPVMVTPRWVETECQPIAVADALHYLVTALETPETAGRTLDIGGPDIVTYRELMEIMARSLNLPRRRILPVPVFTPELSSLWIHLVTPVSRHIARPLALGLKNRVVCRNDDAGRFMPHRVVNVEEAISLALARFQSGESETAWFDAGVIPGDPDWAGGTTFKDRRSVVAAVDAPGLYRAVCRVGGRQGWYSASWLWNLRGFLDRLVGGPGLHRGRRNPDHVSYGEVLDFWRVTEVIENRHLALRAEMKLPGEAVLQFEIEPTDREDRTVLVQTALFRPKGLVGLAYWYVVLPFHGYVFRRMLQGIRKAAEEALGEPNRTAVPQDDR